MLKNLLKKLKKKCQYRDFEQDGKTYNLYDLPDGFVIKGSLNLRNKGLEELPDLSKVTVEGDFDCGCNRLTSLKGAPQEVGGSFYCQENSLTSLEFAPQKIGEHFRCDYNQLTSLEGAPQEVPGNFDCSDNKLTTLEFVPQKVGEDFICGNNELTSLRGMQQVVNSVFECNNNFLTSLEGGPQVVGGRFDCSVNQLTSLEGAPQTVCGAFVCSVNKLKSLVGLPELTDDKYGKIYCDYELAKKYGFKCEEYHRGIPYEDLLESQAFQNEEALIRVAHKARGQNREQESAERQAKHKAGFAAFKKKINEERE